MRILQPRPFAARPVRGLLVAALLGLFLPAAPAEADMLSLEDGRFITGRPIERTDKGYVVHYEHGDVFVPAAAVAGYYESDAEGEFVPRTDDEKAKAEKGLAPWQGGWIKKSKRDKFLRDSLEIQRTRLEQQ